MFTLVPAHVCNGMETKPRPGSPSVPSPSPALPSTVMLMPISSSQRPMRQRKRSDESTEAKNDALCSTKSLLFFFHTCLISMGLPNNYQAQSLKAPWTCLNPLPWWLQSSRPNLLLLSIEYPPHWFSFFLHSYFLQRQAKRCLVLIIESRDQGLSIDQKSQLLCVRKFLVCQVVSFK